MTNTNGVTPVEDYSQPESEASEEPMLTSYSLDYWAEMTERQIERLRARIRELEDVAAPLRLQIAALSQALRTTMGAGPGRPKGTRRGVPNAGPKVGERSVLGKADQALIRGMVEQGKTPVEVRDALPHLPKMNVYNLAYNHQQRLAKEQVQQP